MSSRPTKQTSRRETSPPKALTPVHLEQVTTTTRETEAANGQREPTQVGTIASRLSYRRPSTEEHPNPSKREA
ncbi:hypothetical protein VTI74DRAFT_658 [Chaetomium olivicolor]